MNRWRAWESEDPTDDEIPSAKPPKDMVDLATQLINQKSSAFAADRYQDHYQSALKQLVQDKLKGAKIVAPGDEPRPKGANVVDLMEALKRSLGGSKPGDAKPAEKSGEKEPKVQDKRVAAKTKPRAKKPA